MGDIRHFFFINITILVRNVLIFNVLFILVRKALLRLPEKREGDYNTLFMENMYDDAYGK